MKRLNKKIKLDFKNNIDLIYGSTNKDNPQVIYLSGKCWVLPVFDGDYNFIFNNIKKEFNHYITTFIKSNNIFSNKFILDFDISIDGLSMNNKKFLSFNIFLKQKNDPIFNLNNPIFLSKFQNITDKLEELLFNNGFKIFAKK